MLSSGYISRIRIFLPAALLAAAGCIAPKPSTTPQKPTARLHPDSLNVLAETSIQEEDYSEALRLYKTALDLDPTHMPSLRGLAAMLEKTRDPASARHYYTMLSKSADSTPEDYLALARTSLVLSDEAGTLEALESAAARFPGRSDIQYELGTFYRKLRKIPEARTHLRKAIELESRNKDALRALGEIDFENENYKEARRTYEQYHALNPTDFLCNLRLAFIYFQEDAFDEALPHYRKAIQATPKSIDARVGLAKTLEKLGRKEAATRAYAKALDIDPNNPAIEPIILALANLLNKQGQFEETIKLINDKSTPESRSAGLSCALGIALAGEGRYANAIESFQKALGDPHWSEFADAQIKRIRKLRSYGSGDPF